MRRLLFLSLFGALCVPHAASAQSLERALEQEQQILDEEKRSLEAQLEQIETRRAEELTALRAQAAGLTRRQDALYARAGELEAELARLDAQLASASSASGDVDLKPALAQPLAELARRGAPAPDTQLGQTELLEHVSAQAATLLEQQGSVRVVQEQVFGADGRRGAVSIVRFGEVAAVSQAGPLVPVGASGSWRVLEAQELPALAERRAFPAVIVDPSDAGEYEPWRESLDADKLPGKTWQDTIEDGGPVGAVILLLGAFGVLVALFKSGWLWRTRRRDHELYCRAVRALHNDDWGELPRLAKDIDGPMAGVVRQALDHKDLSFELFDDAVSSALSRGTGQLARGLTALRVIAAVAPLLGLLGTVVGMIATFDALQAGGAGDPTALSGGISQALATTELGLLVAVPSLLLHAALASWVEHESQQLEEAAVELAIHVREEPGHTHEHTHQHVELEH